MQFLGKLLRCVFMWHLPQSSIKDISRADVILTQAVSLLKDGSPGPGNKILADVLRELHEKFPDKPIIPQEELSLAAPELPYFAIAKRPPSGVACHSNSAWNTEAVVSFQHDICEKHGWKKAAVVAMPDHQGRTVMVMERFGFVPIVVPVPGPQEIYFNSDCFYFSQRGHRWRFLLREFLCRIYFLLSSRL